ncbi:unnamed protein product, partial [Ectocarpus sp. 8 AP-2014]
MIQDRGPIAGSPCTLAVCVDLANALPSYIRRLRDNSGGATSTVLLLAATSVLCAYLSFLRRSSQGSTPGFRRLRSKPAGAGKEGKNWENVVTGRGKDGGGVQVTWLGSRELRVLEAWADTLLPGFDVDDKEAADAIAEQMVAMVRANLFRKDVGPRERGKTTSGRRGRGGGGGVLAWKRPNVNNRSQEQLPVKVEAYTRTLVRRCLAMHGRSGSDVGVAVLLAQAFEINISEEERSGLRVLFRVLSTRLGAFILTGRAVPFQSQSLAARHGVLKRWSVSRIRPLRDAFQGVKRLTCSLFFSAHPEVHHKLSHPEGSGAESTAALAKIKTNPNWIDIRYDPQHHRFARSETLAVSSAGQRLNPIAAAAAGPGLWSGAKVKDRVSQTARAAAAVASTAPRPSRSLSANSNS